ncbi:hypothetical protein ElyMa_003045400 [Elysia marginata]|uniref:FLYWCH-type domain-containing protein n=1 Tax=Elysia marginata TaxID=1093978 RepID=A0AAV4IIQ8_9GAST|nr:hypothetical protein ElyMa_003045400 [Elysia marginata]
MDLKFTETTKGKLGAFLDGQIYRLMSESNSSRTWRCTKKNSKARFTTSLATSGFLHGMTNHTHDVQVNTATSQNHQMRQSWLTLDGKSLHLDFEKAAHTAAKAVISGITLKGCLFHLKQSWWRCNQREGLGEEFKSPDSEISQFLKTTFGLPFLDHLDVCESFTFDILLQAPLDEKVDPYLNYLMKTYMSSTSTFPPTLRASTEWPFLPQSPVNL